ncbi:MAG TPA: SIS domain-containing protein [Lacipirellulaceae bacterium]|nr:SIS domain-containing protein [Lacipirellulaceae bacterium]
MTQATTNGNSQSSAALIDSQAIIRRQARELVALNESFFEQQADRIEECCRAMARRFNEGGRLLTIGNGGSCCDAMHMAVECTHPIIAKRPALPAIALTTDIALLTAVGNDQDFSFAFVDQLKLLGRKGDMLMGFSTSGKSRNLTRAFQAARDMNILTIGCAGKDGGRLPDLCEFSFVVPSFSIPRIQETQETLLHIMWDLIHILRGEEDVL